MKSNISVPIPTSQFLALVNFLKNEQDVRDPVEVIQFAIEYFIDNAGWKQDDLIVKNSALGYQWKGLFLPDGSQVRLPYKGQNYYAAVKGDQFLFEGRATSPSAFANSVTKSSRNAWITLWVRRPGDKEWALANDLRPSDKSGAELLARLQGAGGDKSTNTDCGH